MKILNKLPLAIFVTTILLMCSCTKDEDVLTDATENAKAGEHKELDSKKTYTDEELSALGYKSIGLKQTYGAMAFENNLSQRSAALTESSLVDLADLRAIDPNYADQNFMRDRLTWGVKRFYDHDLINRGQQKVKGVWVNEVQFGSGNNVSSARGWAVTKKLTYNHIASNDVWTDWKEETSQRFPAPANADLKVEQYTPYKRTVAFSTSFETMTGSNVTASIGFEVPTWGLNGGLELGFQQSTTKGTFESASHEYVVVVPPFVVPKGKRIIKAVFSRMKIVDRTYRTPVRMYGRVAMDYGTFAFGDPYWSLNADGEVFYELNNDQKRINLRVKEQGAIEFEVRDRPY